jgi:ring-1,2-phenylacetyl-CoA epoxidase subunit PaaE
MDVLAGADAQTGWIPAEEIPATGARFDDDSSGSRRPVFHRLPVKEIESITDDAVAITFDVPPELASSYDFIQGQHLTIRTSLAGDAMRRSYSICAPSGHSRLRIGVKVLPGGHFSGFAQGGLKPGDELEVMTPAGRFFTPLNPANAKHYCAVAAGSGITPILSIIATSLEREPHSRVTLIYGNRTSRSVMFIEDLEDLKNRYPERFQLIHVLSREPSDSELLSGRIDRERFTRITAAFAPVESVDDWFLCGPYEMVFALRDTLTEQGVKRRHIHSELFHVEAAKLAIGETTDDGAGSDVTVILDGRRSSFKLSHADVPVLEAALRVRSDAPFACRGGVCGTCRARLVRGTVEMDTNYALEPEEIDRGYVLTCQSHPTSPEVVLDYDN